MLRYSNEVATISAMNFPDEMGMIFLYIFAYGISDLSWNDTWFPTRRICCTISVWDSLVWLY